MPVIRVALQPATTAIDQDVLHTDHEKAKTPHIHHFQILVKSGSVCKVSRTSEELLKTVSTENFGDFQWYFEQYVIDEPFAHARAKVIRRRIRRQGGLLLENYLLPVIRPSVDQPEHFLIEIKDAESSGRPDGFTLHRFFWEILEDKSLWRDVFQVEPASVTVVHVYENKTPKTTRVDQRLAATTINLKTTNVLAITARPSHTKDIPHRLITRSISTVIDSIRDSSKLQATLEIVRPGTFHALVDHLHRFPPGHFEIAHLDLHGDADGRGGRLTFTQSGARLRPEPDEREAEEVASLLAGSGVTTAVINACRSAAGLNEASNIASLLVQTGIKFAIGMSFNVLSLSADRFMRDFYSRFLVHNVSPIEAVSYARGQLRRNTQRLSKYHTNVNIEDHLVPIVHCQGSELSNVLRQLPAQMSNDEPDDVPTMSFNLFGREGDILRLEWMLTQFDKSRVHVQGHPGSGKTSLLKEAIAWWQKTGLFQQVIYIQLTDPQFQDCTAEVILKFMAKQLRITIENSSIAAIIVALNTRPYLLVLDSLDSIRWSSIMPKPTHERQLWMCLRKLKSCSVVILSRTADRWLGNAIQSWILLEPVDLPNAIAIGTGILQDLDLSSKMVATRDDQSYFEQLVAMSQGNPLAIKVMMYDLARHFAEEPSMTLESHLMSILQLRPIFIDTERLSYGGGARAIAELLEWIYDDTRNDSELYQYDEGCANTFTPPDHPFIISTNSLESLGRSICAIRQKNQPPSQPATTARFEADRQFARSGFISAVAFTGFWHNIISDVELYVTTLAALIVARRVLNADAINMFRAQLCESIYESPQDFNHVYSTSLGKTAFGTPHYCMYAATKALSKVYQSLSLDLCHFVNGPFQHRFGSTTNCFEVSYYSLDPLVSLVSQSSTARALYPPSLVEDIEVARDSLYKHRLSTWLDHEAIFPSTPYNNAMRMELDYDFYNYLFLMLNYQQLISWPVRNHWQLLNMVIPAAVSDPRRHRLVEPILNRFICSAFQHIDQIRPKYYDSRTGGYIIESQERNAKDWITVSILEISCASALSHAMSCRDHLQKPMGDYLSKWNYIKSRPMFLHLKYLDPDVLELFSGILALNTRWLDILQSGGKSFDVRSGQDYMDDVADLYNRRRRLRKVLNLSEPVDTSDISSNIPAQLIENLIRELNMQDWPMSKARQVVIRLTSDGDRVSVETLTQAVKVLEKLLLEEVEHSNSVLNRVMIHSYLAKVHTELGNTELAVQHRTIREELKGMLEPEVVETIERSEKLWDSYHNNSRSVDGEPVNEAQRVERQLDESRARLSVAEAGGSSD